MVPAPSRIARMPMSDVRILESSNLSWARSDVPDQPPGSRSPPHTRQGSAGPPGSRARHSGRWLSRSRDVRLPPDGPGSSFFGAGPGSGSGWTRLSGCPPSVDPGLRRGQPGSGNPEGGARHVVEAKPLADGYRLSISTVLPADADLERRSGFPTLGRRHRHQSAHPIGIEVFEGVSRQDPLADVAVEELALGVVPGHPIGHLG